MTNLPYNSMSHSILFSDGTMLNASGYQSANNGYIRSGEFCIGIPTSNWATFFSPHVFKVVFLGAQEQVVRPDTARIVTAMTYTNAVWNWTEVHLPRHSMRASGPPPSIYAVPGNSIAKRKFGRCPHPACVGFINVSPESIGGIFGDTHGDTIAHYGKRSLCQ